jgi:hypothetical protein
MSTQDKCVLLGSGAPMVPPASTAAVSVRVRRPHGAMGTAPILHLTPRTAADVASRELPHLFLNSKA